MNKDDLFKKYGVSPETHKLDAASGKFVPRAQLSAPSSNEATIRALRGGVDAPFNAIRESKPAVSVFGPTDKMVEDAGPEGYKPAGNLIEQKGLIPGLAEGLSKPVKEIPHIPNEAPLPEGAHWLQKGLRAKDDIVAGVSNVGIDAANFMQSPLGAASALAASIPAAIRPLAAAFTADSAANVPATFKEVGRSFEEGGTLQDKAQALTGAAANLGFGAVGAYGMKARPLAAGPLSNYEGWLKDTHKWDDFDGPPAMQPEQQQMARKKKAPVPETPETLAAQVEVTKDPAAAKAATLVTPGEVAPPNAEGLAKIETADGTLLANPAKPVKSKRGKKVAAQDLGMTQNEKPPGGDTVVQTVKDGVPVIDEVVKAEDAPAVAAQAEANTPGAEVKVTTPEAVIEERVDPDAGTEVDLETQLNEQAEAHLAAKTPPVMASQPPKLTAAPPSMDTPPAIGSLPDGQRVSEPRSMIDSAVNMLRGTVGSEISPRHTAVGNSINTAMHNAREIAAPWKMEWQAVADKVKPAEVERFITDFQNSERTKIPVNTASYSPELKAYADTFRKLYQDVRREQIAMSMPGPTTIDPTGFPRMWDPKHIKEMRAQQASPEVAAMKESWLREQNARGIPTEAAEAKWHELLGGVEHWNEGMPDPSAHFAALRKAEGFKVPDELTARDFSGAFMNYLDKAGKDMAWFKNVESRPDIMDILVGRDAPLAGHKLVKQAINDFMEPPREVGSIEKGMNIAGSAATSLIVNNPVTRTLDLLSTVPNSLSQVSVFRYPRVLSGLLKTFGEAARAAKENGVIRARNTYADNLIGAGNDVGKVARSLLHGYSKLTLSETMETTARKVAQALARPTVDIYVELAGKGDRRAIEFLQKQGDDWRALAKTDKGRGVLASRLALEQQGHYTGQNLGVNTRQGGIAPFFQMSKWAMEQQNNFKKHQLQPLLRNGDVVPLINYVLPRMVGGYALKQIVLPQLNGKKSLDADLDEIAAAPDKSRAAQALMMKLLGSGSAVGMFGFAGNLMEMAGSLATGSPAHMPENIPIKTATNVGRHLAAFKIALDNGVKFSDAFPKLIDNLATAHVGLYRVVKQKGEQLAGSDNAVNRDLRRDYSVYKRLAGKPIQSINLTPNYQTAGEKKFDDAPLDKNFGDVLREAVKNTEGRPERLRSLRTISTKGEGPSVSKATRQDLKAYLQYIQKTQEKEAAISLYQRLQKRAAENEVKRKLVPAAPK